MPNIGQSANSSVKCALSSLGCSSELRGAIDDLASRIQIVAVRGTHLANHIVARVVQGTSSSEPLPPLPDVFNKSWWQQCFKAAANPQSGKDDILHNTSARLFSGGKIIRLGGAATHAIETLSQDIVVNIRVMLIMNFHKQLRKAFRRNLLCYAAIRDFTFEASDREKLVNYCVWKCVQQGSRFHEVSFPLEDCDPVDFGVDLQAELDDEIDKWRSLYGQLLPCPVPEFISKFTDQTMGELYRWFIDLQRQRRDLQCELTEHFSGDVEAARKCFEKAGKAMRALPLAKLRVGHVAVDRTTLKFLLLELRHAGHPISDLEIPLMSAVEVDRDEHGEPLKKRAKVNEDGSLKQTRNRRKGADDAEQTQIYWSHFPNAQRLIKSRKGARLHPFIRTDGISCSVSLFVPGRPEGREELKAAKRMENRCDLDEGNPTPLSRQDGQRLVAIDPGRRDMVYCFVKTDEANETPTAAYSTGQGSLSKFYRSSQFFGVSTRQHVREAKRKRIAGVTVSLQARTLLSTEASRATERTNLHSALCHLPSNKAFEHYEMYETMMLPILEEAVSAMSARRLRREAFLSYQSRDRALDLICSKICGGTAAPKAQTRPRVLVAFGNGGKVSTTGCGYAPAPQSRLRHRLQHVWGARITLINEFCTSKCCCHEGCCRTMSCIYKKRNTGVVLEKPQKIHGVMRCQEHGFVHRDKNAAVNIMRIYERLAEKKKRPKGLRVPMSSRFT